MLPWRTSCGAERADIIKRIGLVSCPACAHGKDTSEDMYVKKNILNLEISVEDVFKLVADPLGQYEFWCYYKYSLIPRLLLLGVLEGKLDKG